MDESEETVDSKSGGDMNAEYANSVGFQPTIWDLKILFGELSSRTPSVDWHTSMTLSWAQAKLMAYYLQVNLALQESRSGNINVPIEMTPLELPALAESAKNDPQEEAALEKLKALRDAFVASMNRP